MQFIREYLVNVLIQYTPTNVIFTLIYCLRIYGITLHYLENKHTYILHTSQQMIHNHNFSSRKDPSNPRETARELSKSRDCDGSEEESNNGSVSSEKCSLG